MGVREMPDQAVQGQETTRFTGLFGSGSGAGRLLRWAGLFGGKPGRAAVRGRSGSYIRTQAGRSVRTRRAFCSPTIESLEDRRMLSASVDLSIVADSEAGTWQVFGEVVDPVSSGGIAGFTFNIVGSDGLQVTGPPEIASDFQFFVNPNSMNGLAVSGSQNTLGETDVEWDHGLNGPALLASGVFSGTSGSLTVSDIESGGDTGVTVLSASDTTFATEFAGTVSDQTVAVEFLVGVELSITANANTGIWEVFGEVVDPVRSGGIAAFTFNVIGSDGLQVYGPSEIASDFEFFTNVNSVDGLAVSGTQDTFSGGAAGQPGGVLEWSHGLNGPVLLASGTFSGTSGSLTVSDIESGGDSGVTVLNHGDTSFDTVFSGQIDDGSVFVQSMTELELSLEADLAAGTWEVFGELTNSDSLDGVLALAAFNIDVIGSGGIQVDDTTILEVDAAIFPILRNSGTSGIDIHASQDTIGDGGSPVPGIGVGGSVLLASGTFTANGSGSLQVVDHLTVNGPGASFLRGSEQDGFGTEFVAQIIGDSVDFIVGPPQITTDGSAGVEDDGNTQNFGWNITDGDPGTVLVTIAKAGQTIYTSSALSGNFNFDAFGLGTYRMVVTAADELSQATTVDRSVTVFDDDTASASISLSGSQGTEFTDQTQQFGWVASDSSGFTLVDVSVTKDGVEVMTSAASSGNINFDNLGAGEFEISVRVVDGDQDWTGDSKTSVARRSVNVVETSSQLPPDIQIGGSAGDETDGELQEFSWSVTDANSDLATVAVEVSRDGESLHSSAAASDSFNFDSLGTGQFTIDITATDAAGNTSVSSQTVVVTDDDTVGPTIVLSGSIGSELTSQTQQFDWDVSDSSGVSTVEVSVTRNGDLIFSASTATGTYNFDGEGAGDYVIEVNATDADDDSAGDSAAISGVRSVSVEQDDLSTFQVLAFTPTPSGFLAEFTDTVDTSTLNLFVDQADVSLVNPDGVPLRGSLVTTSANSVAFVVTGGVLSPDNYSVVIRSGEDAFRSVEGALLDGNGDGGTADYTTSMTVSASGPVLSLPDFARGPGQAVNVPASDTGVPISISTAESLTSIDFELRFDETMLDVSGLIPAGLLPSDWTMTSSSPAPGVLQVSLAGETPISGTDIELVSLEASVPQGVLLSQTQVISIENVSLNGGDIAATGDQAVHQAAYLGDVDGDGVHTAFDASLIAGVVVQIANGFEAFASTDPVIVGNSTGTGRLSGLDAAWVAQKSVDLERPEIPTIPSDALPATEAFASGEGEFSTIAEVLLVNTSVSPMLLSESQSVASDKVFSAIGADVELAASDEVASPVQSALAYVDFTVDPIESMNDAEVAFEVDEIVADLADSLDQYWA